MNTLLALLLGILLVACSVLHGGRAPDPAVAAQPRTVETRYVSCMAEPPPFEDIDWPQADSVGNVLMHASTVDRVRGAYATLRRYTSEQYFRCLHVAEAAGETSVTVEREP